MCRTYFPQNYTGIRVFNRRKPSIGVDLEKWYLLGLIELDKLVLEGDAELFEDDVYLTGISLAISA